MNSSTLIIMAKEPKVGFTKTRLCPPLKLDEAAQLFEVLLLDTIQITIGINGIDLAIAVTPPQSTDYFKRITPPGTNLIPVTCADIGECLNIVLDQLLQMGYSRVMALNADSPSLPPEYIQKAVQSLDIHDLVLGPAEDGGYYLIGFKQLHSSLFMDIKWSSNQVLTQTINKAEELGLSVHLLPSWYDVDSVKDLQRLKDELKTLPANALVHTRQFLVQWTELK